MEIITPYDKIPRSSAAGFFIAFLVIDQTADILINLRGNIRLDPKSEQFKRRYREMENKP